jgi:acetyltransferase-like isoleucine patch superfamily enzyme
MSIIRILMKLSTWFNQIGSSIMKLLLRLNGAKIGRNSYVSLSSRIVSKKLVIGNDVIIKSGVKIKSPKVEIGHGCIISEDCYITGNSDFKLGNTSFIGKKVRINLSKNVTIGKDVGIGENSVIWTHGYFPPADEGFPVTYKPVSIMDGAWVSTNIIILPGVILGKNTIVGAGSVVTKSFEDFSLIAGNPAKYMKNANELKNDKEFIEIMKGIFDNYSELTLLEEGNKYLIYKLKEFKVYILSENNDLDRSKINPRKSLVIFKGIDFSDFFKTNDYNWFDLSDRILKNMSLREAKFITKIFRDWGIRLVVDYK